VTHAPNAEQIPAFKMTRKKYVPTAVRRYMSRLADKANAKMRGTAMARKRGRKAAQARWSKK
jgi:hypothetical protein